MPKSRFELAKAKFIKLNEVNIGQGEGPTKRNGCNWWCVVWRRSRTIIW